MNTSINSEKEFAIAQALIPGGVNSPVRSFNGIDGKPVFVKQTAGATMTDVDDNKYIDYCMSWGVHILGHTNKRINERVIDALGRGASYGIASPYESHLAKLIIDAVPTVEMVRLVSSGTEAVMSAIRLARAYTKKNKIIKFDGCYHGHVDHLLVSAGSGLATFGQSSSKGVPDDFVKHTISVPYNNKEAVADIFNTYGNDIAAIIIEPVPANMGLVLPEEDFLPFLRDITRKFESLLIFDEVITGFRLAYGGAQEYFNIDPDITTMGKIIGGGFPIGAYGARKEIMQMISPLGPMYQAGTLSGNPIAVSAGIAVLETLQDKAVYTSLAAKTKKFTDDIKDICKGKPITVKALESLFTIFFTDKPMHNFEDVKQCDTKAFAKFYRDMLNQGVYLAPSQFEANFLSTAHTDDQLSLTLSALKKVL